MEYFKFLDTADVLFKEGKSEMALAELNKALELNPDDKLVRAQIIYNMGIALATLNNFQEAIEKFNETIDIVSDYTPAYIKIGTMLEKLGRAEEAIDYYRKAIEINSRDIEALFKLSSVLMSWKYPGLRDIGEAVNLSEKACDITYYREPVMLITLANAYAESGNFTRAVENAEKALKIAELKDRYQYVDRIKAQLSAYKRNKTVSEIITQ